MACKELNNPAITVERNLTLEADEPLPSTRTSAHRSPIEGACSVCIKRSIVPKIETSESPIHEIAYVYAICIQATLPQAAAQHFSFALKFLSHLRADVCRERRNKKRWRMPVCRFLPLPFGWCTCSDVAARRYIVCLQALALYQKNISKNNK